MGIADFVTFTSPIVRPIADFFSNRFLIPFSPQSVWITAISLFMIAGIWAISFNKHFLISKRLNLVLKLTLSALIFSTGIYFVWSQVNSTIYDIRNNDIIIAKLDSEDNQEACGKFAESLEHEIKYKISRKTSYYLNWKLKNYEKSIVQNVLKVGDRPIVVIGGFCEINDSFGQYSIELKILKAAANIKLPSDLNGSFVRFPIIEMKSYKLQAKAANAIVHTIKALDALLYECQGDCSKAIGVYTDLLNSIEKENKDLRAYVYEKLSVVYYALNNSEQAESTINEAIKAIPDDEGLKLARSTFYLMVKKPDLALIDLNAIKSTITYKESRLLNLSAVLAMQGRFKEASSILDNVHRSEINDPDLISNVAYAAVRTMNLPKALELSNFALTKDPNNYGALIVNGLTKFKNGQLAEAIQAYDKAIAISPGRSEAYGNKGMTLLDTNNDSEALLAVNKAIELGNRTAETLLTKAVATSRLSLDKKDAEEAFLHAYELDPKSFNLFFQRGIYYSRIKDFKSSINDLKKAISINPDFTQAYIYLAAVQADRGNKQEAIQLLKKASSTSDAEHFSSNIKNFMDSLQKSQNN